MIAQRIKRAGILSLVFLLAISGLSPVLPGTPRAHAAATEPLLGEIRLFPYDAAPNGWVPAEGQLLPISSNTELFSLLGANYGVGDNQTFVLPNLSNQAPGGTRYYIATTGTFPSREEGSGIANAVLGEIRLFPYYYSPSGWLTAEGQTLEIASFPSLYSLIGKKYGGDGETTFQLPNLPTNEQTPLHYAIFTNSTYSPLTGGTGDEYMGEIIPMPVQVSNPEWIQADGTLLTIDTNRALFDLLGNRYGGDGMTQFNIPDLTGDPSGIIYYISKVGASPIGDRALANNDQYLTNEGTTLTVASPGILANDINVSTARLINSPTNGAITLNSNGAFMYTPNTGFSGNDSFQYIGSGSIGDSNLATVTITVVATNKPVITGVNDQTTYNGPVTPTFDGGTALLNGSPFTSGTSITGDGSYTLAVTNNAGTITVHFVIDSTPPVVIGVANDAVYETAPTITFNEGTATLDGSPFASGGTVSREGTHVLIVTDGAGNTTTVAFEYYAPRTVTFVSSGGTDIPAQSIRYESRLTEPDAPSRTGYTFEGWFTDSELTQPFDFDNTVITDNLTLYAKWTVHSFNVQFNSNGGSAVDGQQVDYNALVHRPDAPSRTGYAFAGWFTDSELTQAFDFDNTVITDNLTLYAKWTVRSFNVQFNSNGGSAVDGQQVDYNALAHQPDAPSRTGYTFAGWFTDSELTQAFDFDNTVITDNLTLYAKWTVRSFNVQFNSNGGSAVDGQQVDYNALAHQPDAPSRTGYTFAGWFTDSELTQAFDFDNTVITDNLTLYAKWTAIPAGNTGGGSGGGSEGGGSSGSGSSGGTGSSGSSGSSSSVSTPGSSDAAVSTDGRLTLAAGQPGRISLGTAITMNIPKGASPHATTISINKLADPEALLTNQKRLLSPVYELLKDFPDHFGVPVNLDMAFDTALLASNERAEIMYFDEQQKIWIPAGASSTQGSRVQVNVDHFTKFAVFAIAQPEQPEPASFRDIKGHWAENIIIQAVREGIVKGYSDGSFKPGKAVTRAEFVVMLMNRLQSRPDDATAHFTDNEEIGSWAQSAVAQAASLGYIQGGVSGAFRPQDPITRAEMAVMLANVLGAETSANAATTFADDASIPAWARTAVASMQRDGFLAGRGNNRFAPASNATRAEALNVLMQINLP